MGDRERVEAMTQEEKVETGRALGRLREFLGRSQKEIAETAQLPRTTYTNMERYGMGSPETFEKALCALGTDLDRLREWHTAAQEIAAKATGTAG